MDDAGPSSYCSLWNKNIDCEKHRIGIDHFLSKLICAAAILSGVFRFGAFGIAQQPNSESDYDSTGSGCLHRTIC